MFVLPLTWPTALKGVEEGGEEGGGEGKVPLTVGGGGGGKGGGGKGKGKARGRERERRFVKVHFWKGIYVVCSSLLS